MSYPTNDLAYTTPYGLSKRAPKPVSAARAPVAATDVGYDAGTVWCKQTGSTATDGAYLNIENVSGTANWQPCAGGSLVLSTLTGDTGTATPSNGNIKIAGTANQIVTSASGSTVTLALTGPYTPATYTAHGVLIGEGTSSIVATAAGTTGQVLIGSTGADPAFGALGVNSGLTAHGVLLGEGNSAIAATAVGDTGTVLAGNSGADPSFTATPTLTSVTFGSGNALNTYVENTSFTPVLEFGGGSTGITYGSREGRYMKIGKLVIFMATIVLTNKGSSSGNATLTGLPFAAAATNPSVMYVLSQFGTVTFAANSFPASYIVQGDTAVTLGTSTGSTSAIIQDTAFANTSSVTITGYYFSAT